MGGEARRRLTQLQRVTHRALARVKGRLRWLCSRVSKLRCSLRVSRLRGTAATRVTPPGGSFSRTRRSWLWGGARPYSSTVLEEGSLMAEASPLVRGHARTGASSGAAPCMCHACAMHAMHMTRMHMHQVRALCHEAVQHVVKGEDVSIRREGHLEEARGYAHFAIDTLSLHLPGQEAIGLDQLVSIEHLPASHLLVPRPATLSERAARAAGSTSLPTGLTSRRHSSRASGRTSGSTSGSSSCLFRANERTATPTRYRNVVRVGFIDAQGGDRSGLDTHSIDIYLMRRRQTLSGRLVHKSTRVERQHTQSTSTH